MFEKLVFEVQRLYPQIYLACHVDHIRAVSTRWQVSSRDASILSHLSQNEGTSPRTLGAHLGVVPSTLSAALSRLVRLGYIRSILHSDDKRRRELWLTAKGVKALGAASVLDAHRIRGLLQQLSADEREDAIRGLTLLAKGARRLKENP